MLPGNCSQSYLKQCDWSLRRMRIECNEGAEYMSAEEMLVSSQPSE